MNNNFQNQQNWPGHYQNQQNWSSNQNHQNRYQNYRPRNNGPNYDSNRGPNLSYQNNRFNHHSNINNNWNYRNDNHSTTNYSANYRNNFNSHNNHNGYSKPTENQFQNNFDFRRNFESQSSNNYFNRGQNSNFNETKIPSAKTEFSDSHDKKENENWNPHTQKIKLESNEKTNYDVKPSYSTTSAIDSFSSIKQEPESGDPKLKEKSSTSKSSTESTRATVKTELKDIKSELLETATENDEIKNTNTEYIRKIRSTQLLRTSKRTTQAVEKVFVEDSMEEDDEEVEVKVTKRTRKRKVESSDDEYVPEEVASVKPKTTRARKTVKSEIKPDPAYDDMGNEEHTDGKNSKEATAKAKPARKPRVTKKMKLEENCENESSEKNIVKKTKAVSKQTKKVSACNPVKKTVKTEVESHLTNDCEEPAATKKVATKRKVKASKQDEDLGEGQSSQKSRKVFKPNPNESYWTDEKLLAEMCQCEAYVAWNFIKLINSDNTIPFIARYRKEMVQNFEAEKLREMKQAYENISDIRQKAETVIGKIVKLKKLTPELKKSILCCRSLEELDLIYSPYKVGSKGTKAEKAKKLGLEEPALALLNGEFQGDMRDLVNAGKTELNTVHKVKDGIQHIIADILSKDTAVLETLQELMKSTKILFESTKTKQAGTIDNFDKYETYFSYSCDIKFVKPHAVLAINRGESHKVLSVNVKLNEWLQRKLFDFCKQKWLSQGAYSPQRLKLFQDSYQDSFKRLIKPFIVRSIRNQLNQTAEIASIQVFASNLKQLLLVPPMHGAVIMAIDPGYSHGCKVAVIDVNGNVLATDTLYIKFSKGKRDSGGHSSGKDIKDINALKLRDIVLRHRCELVAIGNGTACRETETYMSDLIQSNWFEPLNVCYTIISEQGASIYSCSAEAKKEFPDLDPNVVSAVSLARRLQDPLSELVKIEPKHLGVGMYQHDVPEKQLTSTLNEVVSECVSFVGVDINCASQVMLRRLAGLTEATAANIIKHRTEHGPFQCREDLRKVKGIGEKRFEQCAGFVRVSYSEHNKKHDALDSTWIHPESYDIARKFARDARVNLSDLGKDHFISAVNQFIGARSPESWVEEYSSSATTIGLIIEAFRQPRDFDLRSKLSKPLFKKGIQSLDDIASGTILTGKINNVTHFGCFVDIGLERDALIHSSKLRGQVLRLNEKVNVRVIDVDRTRKRVGLEFIELLS